MAEGKNRIMADLGFLILRLAVGLIILVHGLDLALHPVKALAPVARLGMRPVSLWAFMNPAGQLVGGLSLTLGLLTPMGGALVVGSMVVATMLKKVNGFWNVKDGCEFPLLLGVGGLGLGLAGSGPYSLDAIFGLQSLLVDPVLIWALMAGGLVGGTIGWMSRSSDPAPTVMATPPAPATQQ